MLSNSNYKICYQSVRLGGMRLSDPYIWLLPAMDDGNHEMQTVVQHDYKAIYRLLMERKLGSWWKGGYWQLV